MCHPAVLAAVSIAGSLAGGAAQAQGAQQQAEAQAQAEEQRAKLAERQKDINQTQGSFERKRTLEQYEKSLGFNRAAGAERGLSETGSLTDIADDNAFEAAQSIEAIRYRAEGQRGNLTFEANAARQRAQSHRKAGRIGAFSAMLGGVTGAFTTLGNAVYARDK
ncbi:hypothetical protein [Roseibium album]|uniref:virion core protein, T7 gp14 family n=1 Tax=Roseibium album TaxID=311410 RepID=UPI000CF08A57|nr:hypothetical protein [Roseibium album]MBG6145088.1 multidrug efflux pump subunit AcrA (membrane-fusion protein) [Labrenzia sp. EL_142]MBG6156740.1 multidrug efflux pump subunit AcrA (membrane-fusion protein) [Labrenzia sp. EL_162]MBG6163648.1 multidrug efflux pump subunit AcrA (membrane-fusion protein) [Labrenzia sp. EL_195]MBG6195320.1 multidrug efflux pump subunit AcrA (membrane-fusion protein) [Labrenzia sp. EL_159]